MADDQKDLDDEATEMAGEQELADLLEATPQPNAPRSNEMRTDPPLFEEEVEKTPASQRRLTIASLADRFVAGCIDLLALGYLYLATLMVYTYIVWQDFFSPNLSRGNHLPLFLSIYALLAFLYFFIAEGVFFTTLGKFCARLSVRNKRGEGASLFAILLRNLLRPVDALLGFGPLWFMLEKTELKQRLGDWMSGTIVMKNYSRSPHRTSVTGHTASASLRMLSGSIDLVFSFLWIGGILLFLDHQRPVFSFLLFTTLPIFYFLWHTVWETFLQTTLGLWIFGCKIVTEEGSPISFTHSFLRTLFRLFDTNPFGWMTLFLSRKNQRPSDLAAGTVVVHAKRSFSSLMGAGISLGLIGGIWLWGLTYPNNYLTPFFRFDLIAGKITQEILAGTSRRPVTQNIQGRKLLLKDFHYMNQDRSTERQSSIFKPGERIFFSFSLSGFTVRDSQVWIQEDLTVRYPDNSIGFKQENIVEFRQHLKDPEQPVEIVNTLILPAEAQAGNYTLILQLRDRLSNRQLTEQRTFRVVR